MITDAIVSLFFGIPGIILYAIPTMNIVIPDGAMDELINILHTASYILPISGLMKIIIVSMTIKGIQIVWSLVIRIKSFIPTMGA